MTKKQKFELAWIGKVDVRNIKVEDVADEELLDNLSDTEASAAYAEILSGGEE